MYLGRASGQAVDTIYIFDPSLPNHRPQQVATLTGTVEEFKPSQDGSRVLLKLSTADYEMWDIAAGKRLSRFKLDSNLSPEKLSPNGLFLSVLGGWVNNSTNREVQFWDTTQGTSLEKITASPYSIGFLNDGFYAFDVQKTKLTVHGWSTTEGKFNYTLNTETKGEFGSIVIVLPGGKFFITEVGSEYRLYDLATGQIHKTIRLPASANFSFFGGMFSFLQGRQDLAEKMFSTDGQYFLSTNLFGPAILWDANTGVEVRRFDIPADEGSVVGGTIAYFSADNEYVVTQGMAVGQNLSNVPGEINGSVNTFLWIMDYEHYACSRLLRDLTDAERQKYNITDLSPICATSP